MDNLKMIENEMPFEEYFIRVCELKVSLDKEELKLLKEIVAKNVNGYSSGAIVYLCDCIVTEILLPCNKDSRKTTEKEMCKEVIENFKWYFPGYTFIKNEKNVPGVGKIDIFALHDKVPVIIELKIKRKSPNSQLIAYSSNYKGAELIGITEEELPEEMKIPNIKYYTINDLRKFKMNTEFLEGGKL